MYYSNYITMAIVRTNKVYTRMTRIIILSSRGAIQIVCKITSTQRFITFVWRLSIRELQVRECLKINRWRVSRANVSLEQRFSRHVYRIPNRLWIYATMIFFFWYHYRRYLSSKIITRFSFLRRPKIHTHARAHILSNNFIPFLDTLLL